MLSFKCTSEKDKVLAQIYSDADALSPTAEIFYTPKFSGASQIVHDDISALLKFERLRFIR